MNAWSRETFEIAEADDLIRLCFLEEIGSQKMMPQLTTVSVANCCIILHRILMAVVSDYVLP
jgi:hypothetical protein